MKLLSITLMLFVIILIVTSCRKQATVPLSYKKVIRKVQFKLYTDKDFSGNNALITFKPSIQNAALHTLWDSILAPMKIKEIPGLEQRLLIEKALTEYDTSLLKVGFFYSIENVGNSWHLESFNPGEVFKIVDFDFQ